MESTLIVIGILIGWFALNRWSCALRHPDLSCARRMLP